MNHRKTILIIVFICIAFVLKSQNYFANSLSLSYFAQESALGGSMISSSQPSNVYNIKNPALLQDTSQRHVYLAFKNYNFHTQITSLLYTTQIIKKSTPLYVNINRVSYGQIKGYTENEEFLGNINIQDIVVKIGSSYKLKERISVGLSLGVFSSSTGQEKANAIFADIGVQYMKSENSWQYGLLLRNMGIHTKALVLEKYDLPVELMLGASKKLEHLPLTINITYKYLNKWKMYFDNAYNDDQFILTAGDSPQLQEIGFFENLIRHFVFSTKLDLGQKKKTSILLSFDVNKNQAASINNLRTLSGLGLGFQTYFKKIELSYTYNVEYFIGRSHHLGIGVAW